MLSLREALGRWLIFLPTTCEDSKRKRIRVQLGVPSHKLLCWPHLVVVSLGIQFIEADPLSSFVLHAMTCEQMHNEVVDGWLAFDSSTEPALYLFSVRIPHSFECFVWECDDVFRFQAKAKEGVHHVFTVLGSLRDVIQVLLYVTILHMLDRVIVFFVPENCKDLVYLEGELFRK